MWGVGGGGGKSLGPKLVCLCTASLHCNRQIPGNGGSIEKGKGRSARSANISYKGQGVRVVEGK